MDFFEDKSPSIFVFLNKIIRFPGKLFTQIGFESKTQVDVYRRITPGLSRQVYVILVAQFMVDI